MCVPLYRLNPILDNDYIQTLQNQRLDEPTSSSKVADETTHHNVPNVTFEEWSLRKPIRVRVWLAKPQLSDIQAFMTAVSFFLFDGAFVAH